MPKISKDDEQRTLYQLKVWMLRNLNLAKAILICVAKSVLSKFKIQNVHLLNICVAHWYQH